MVRALMPMPCSVRPAPGADWACWGCVNGWHTGRRNPGHRIKARQRHDALRATAAGSRRERDSQSMKKLRVLIADDHQIVREGLRRLIDSQPDMSVVGEAVNGKEALAQAAALKPEVVVMDLSMPEMNGLQATARLTAAYPGIRVVALTAHEDESYLRQLCKAGAAGYVLKHSSSDELIKAISTCGQRRGPLRSVARQQSLGPANDRAGGQGRVPWRRIKRSRKRGAHSDGLGLQQQGSCRHAWGQRQDHRNL